VFKRREIVVASVLVLIAIVAVVLFARGLVKIS
jgi:arginine:ornithine antiporter/lysine permease